MYGVERKVKIEKKDGYFAVFLSICFVKYSILGQKK